MKRICVSVAFVLACTALLRCTAKKEVSVQEFLDTRMMPMPSTYTSSDSLFLREQWVMGYHQYKSNCSECHGIFGSGKDSIPNFTQVQFDNYGAAFLAGDKTNHAVMKGITEEEFYSIFLFLQSLERPEN